MLEDRYRALVEELPDYAIFMLDLQGHVTSWNKGAERVLGYTPEEILGQSFDKFFTPEDVAHEVPQRELREAMTTGRASRDGWRVRKDGMRIWAMGVTSAMHDDAHQLIGLAKVMHDMTERRRTEDRLAAQYAVTLILADAATLQEATPKILQTICDTLDWKWGALWEADRREQVLRCVDTYLQAGSSAERFEAISRNTPLPLGIGLPGRVWASGEPAWVTDVTIDQNFPRGPIAEKDDLHGGVAFPIGLRGEIFAVVEFISKDVRLPDPDLLRLMRTIGSQIGQYIRRRSAEDEQRDSEVRKTAIVEAALDCIITMDQQGKAVEWNPAAEKTFGYSREQAIGTALADLIIPPELRERHWQGLAHYLKTGEGPVVGKRIELSAIHADGSRFPVELAITRIPVAGPPMFTAHLRDITARVSAEHERTSLLTRERDARQQAETANRAKDDFLATVSHELRTPLTAMLGWARLLQGEVVDTETLREGLDAIERNTHAQAQLVEDLLDISRIITGKLSLQMRPIDLSPVVTAAMTIVRPAAEARGVALINSIGHGGAVVSGDPDRLQQVVWNLLSNAVKFTDRGGRVEVRITRDESQARIIVTDSGKGIAPDFIPYVFDRFSQADTGRTRKYGGLGLGLAIVRHLVELHGGTVEVDSEGEGRGATFAVRLPLMTVHSRETAPRAGATWRTPAFECPPILDGLKILVVDDEPDARRLVTTVLEKCRATVTAVATVAEAIRAMHESQPDVILSDIGIPGEDGYELIRQVRELESARGWKIPAAALTAYARVEDRMRALSAGYHMFVPKPVEPAELVTIVAQLAGRRG